jgi:hypothetical protein
MNDHFYSELDISTPRIFQHYRWQQLVSMAEHPLKTFWMFVQLSAANP